MRNPDHPGARGLSPEERRPQPRRSALRSVRHALEFAPLALIREALRQLPPERSVALGARLGALYARAHGPRSADAAINLALAFPERSQLERERLRVASFENLGRCLAEACLLQGPHRRRLIEGVSVEGFEHYQAAVARSPAGGVIALTAHFGSWELCGVVMAQRGYPVSVVHHRMDNPHVEAMVGGWRREAGIELIELGRASLGVFRAFSRGRVVTVLIDQNAHREEGVFAPFLGQQALTRSGPATLASTRGIPVLPVFIHRVGSTSRHVIRLHPALELEPEVGDPDGALIRNVGRMNEAVEAAIRVDPDHWLWPHRRFKTRPPGEPPIYRRRRRLAR